MPVTEPDPDLRTGVIIIRLWCTGAASEDLRAQLTVRLDVGSDDALQEGAASVDSLCAQVRHWAEVFLRGPVGDPV